MKRSEILKLIKDHYNCYTNGSSSKEEADKHAESLLDKLEQAGMLPSTITRMKAIEANLNGSAGIFNYAQNINEWESEDE